MYCECCKVHVQEFSFNSKFVTYKSVERISCELKRMAGTERWLESGRASIDMFHVARSPMQKYELRGDPLPRQVHYYRFTFA